jgi:hypothetical protein
LGNGVKYSVVIPEVRDVKNSHPKLLSGKLIHISYGPLAFRLRARVEFEDGGVMLHINLTSELLIMRQSSL